MFQTLTFGIALGVVPDAADRNVTVFIDPHADREPVDTRERSGDTIELHIERPHPMHAHLERMIHQGQGQNLLQDLQSRIERWHFGNEMAPVLDRLNAVASLPVRDRIAAIQTVVEEQMPRLHRLMRHVVRDFREKTADRPETALLLPLLEAQISLNDERDGLSEVAKIPFARVVAAFISELNSKLLRESADMDYMWSLFSGGPGAHIAAQELFQPITAFINDPSNWEPEASGGT